MKSWIRQAAAVFLLGIFMACASQGEKEPMARDEPPAPVDPRPPLQRAQAFYATRKPIEQPQGGYQKIPEGLGSLSAQSCGACHQEIYAEWKVSTHAQAWEDVQFQEERKKSENRWLCDGCHTPLLNQMPSWVVALEDDDVEKPVRVQNPDFDPAFQNEGITCASCHVRDGFVEGPFGNTNAPHATRKAERFRSETVCTACHQAVQSYPGKSFVCTFETGEEWRHSPAAKEGKICQDCHMPEVDRPLMPGFPPRRNGKHFWPGGGVYKKAGYGPPRSELPPGLQITAVQEGGTLVVTLHNANAGHFVPTGDPERFIWVELMFEDPAGKVLKTETLRIGQHWQWWPEPKKLGDTRIPPGQSKVQRWQAPKAAARWRLTAAHHRISKEAIEHHGLHDYPSHHVTHRLEGELAQRSAAK